MNPRHLGITVDFVKNFWKAFAFSCSDCKESLTEETTKAVQDDGGVYIGEDHKLYNMVCNKCENVLNHPVVGLGFLQEAIRKIPFKCNGCNKPLAGKFKHYSHPDGLFIKEEDENRWVYVVCSNCQHQVSHVVLIGQLQDLLAKQ